MKRVMVGVVTCVVAIVSINTASAQAQELEELALDIEKLAQFKQILSDLEKGYAIVEGGYNTIKNISEGNFSLHKAFLDGLMATSPAVAGYKKILTITGNQVQLLKEYKRAFRRFQNDGNFNPDEIRYIGKVYSSLLEESTRNLESLLDVITAGKLRMSDDERIREIDRIDADMGNKLVFLRYFNNNTIVLALQRAKEKTDINRLRLLHGVGK